MTSDRNLCAYYYSFEPTGCDLIDSVLESVANAGSGYHHTIDWRDKYDDGSSPLSNMQMAAQEAADTVLSLIAENEKLRKAVTFSVEAFEKITSSDGSGHADLARAALRIAGSAMSKEQKD